LVITRINTAQMNAIVPSAGAIVYNTDLQCIHYYDGAQWINVCEEVGGIPNLTTDPLVNTNSTLVITPNGENNHIEVAPNSIRTEQIITGGINGDDIQDNSIEQIDIGPDAVGVNEIKDNAVGDSELIDGSITPAKLDITGRNNGDILIIDEGIAIWRAPAVAPLKTVDATISTSIRIVSNTKVAITDSDYTLILEPTVGQVMLPGPTTSNTGQILIIKDLGGSITRLNIPYRDYTNNQVNTTINGGIIWLQSDGTDWQQIN